MNARVPPEYLLRTYRWAYLDRRWLRWLDRPVVVSAILWGNARRLMARAIATFRPGQRVLQAAAVYGDFSQRLLDRLGEGGHLDVVDVAPLQVANVRRKLRGRPNVSTRVADLAVAAPGAYDGVCCFFLLHEVPPHVRGPIVDNLLRAVAPGGHVVFVDYHLPVRLHPLKAPMGWIFRHFEPFAESLTRQEIVELAAEPERFVWDKQVLFGGLYQIVTARAGLSKDSTDCHEFGQVLE
ncbi:MAG: rhodoquinone biosynthesis methyltransferase RquA [Rhodocyclaceae bacterium]|nr:rhodoquinone biosynthesis methyltransferase RquA [Rhodocyclaceae bacterium]